MSYISNIVTVLFLLFILPRVLAFILHQATTRHFESKKKHKLKNIDEEVRFIEKFWFTLSAVIVVVEANEREGSSLNDSLNYLSNKTTSVTERIKVFKDIKFKDFKKVPLEYVNINRSLDSLSSELNEFLTYIKEVHLKNLTESQKRTLVELIGNLSK